MSRGYIWFLAITAIAAVLIAIAFGEFNAGLADFGCFYTEPIGHDKCIGISHRTPFVIGFFETIGVLCIPWSLLLIFSLIRNRWRIK